MTSRPAPCAYGSRSRSGLRRDERVLHLVRDHRPTQPSLRVLPTREREVAHAGVANEALIEDASHSVHRRAVRHHRVGPMHLVEIDDVDAETASTGARPLSDDWRQRHQRKQLRSEEHVVAPAADRLAHDAFRLAVSVGFSGIDEVDPEVEGPLDDRAGLVTGVLVAVAPVARAELPAAQPDDRHPGAVHLDEAHSSNAGATTSGPPARKPGATRGMRPSSGAGPARTGRARTGRDRGRTVG